MKKDISHLSVFDLTYEKWMCTRLINTCERKACVGAAGVALIFVLAGTALGPLFVDFPGLGLLVLAFLPGVVLCSWASF